MGEVFAGPLQPVAQQMLAEACALLLAEGAAELGWAEPAQGGNILQGLGTRSCLLPGREAHPITSQTTSRSVLMSAA